jgi:predicted secreted protein
MAGNVGRADVIKKNGVVIAGVREKSLSWAGEAIDVTSNEDGGIRRLLAEYGQQQLSISLSGVFKDDLTFRNIALNTGTTGHLTDITYEFEDGSEISGPVLLVSYEEGAPYKDATTFSVSLEYSDTWTFTPAP